MCNYDKLFTVTSCWDYSVKLAKLIYRFDIRHLLFHSDFHFSIKVIQIVFRLLV